jgi:hypothetical protein
MNTPHKRQSIILRVITRLFCGHYKWIKTSNAIGCLYEHKCQKCGKKIYRGILDSPVSMV